VPGLRTRESILDTSAAANRAAPVSPMGEGRRTRTGSRTGRGRARDIRGMICSTGHPRVPRGQVAAPSGRGPRTLLKTTRGWGSAPFRRDCSQDCSQAAEQHPTHVDNPGISAQPTTGDGRSRTTCPLLRSDVPQGKRVPVACPIGGKPGALTVTPGEANTAFELGRPARQARADDLLSSGSQHVIAKIDRTRKPGRSGQR
jgi:hypothetical protein